MSANQVNPVPLKQFGFFRRQDPQRFMTRLSGPDALLSDAGRWFLTSGDKDV
jgi:hypothetical protein